MRRRMAIQLAIMMFVVFIMVTALAATGFAEVPQKISYQGKLTDDAGEPLDGDYLMKFTIYDDSTEGTALWWEVQMVTVTNGIYNINLGLFFPGLFDGPRWIGVTVGEDSEMTPRQQLTSVPYALQAAGTSAGAVTEVMLADEAVTESKVADGAITAAKIVGGSDSGLDSDKLDGQDASFFATASQLAELQTAVGSLQDQLTTLQNENQVLKDKLKYVSVVGSQMYITGANLHVRSGSGATGGTVNGLGNVVIGYDEARDWASCSLGRQYSDQASCEDAGGQWWTSNKSGSHNLVVGDYHNYNRFGGIVTGRDNTISADYASVSGGWSNTASGVASSVNGGNSNTASGEEASVSGGIQNISSGLQASVSGGATNNASGRYSSVSGGDYNTASDWSASVSGGHLNTAIGVFSSVSGGYDNTASGEAASVSGGLDNIASGSRSSVSGGGSHNASGLSASISGGGNNEAIGQYTFIGGGGNANSDFGNLAFANYSAILGGMQNITGDTTSGDQNVGYWSSVSGGYKNTAIGNLANVSGGSFNTASGGYASISGGEFNTAGGLNSSVNGGLVNNASGTDSSISGGGYNEASDHGSTVSGGDGNTASEFYSSVSGGNYNTASGESSSVSGGNYNTASGASSSVSGGRYNKASGSWSFVGGGGHSNSVYGNEAFSDYSAVLGGSYNIAGDNSDPEDHSVGELATVLGGDTNRAKGGWSSVTGGKNNTAVNALDSVVGDTGKVFVDSTPVH